MGAENVTQYKMTAISYAKLRTSSRTSSGSFFKYH